MVNKNKTFYLMGHDYTENQDWCWLGAKKDKFKNILNDVWIGKSVVDTLNGSIEMHMDKKEGSSLLCDYIGTWHNVHIISEKFKNILENEKPVSFEFLPIQIFDKKGKEKKAAFYVANIQTFQDCLITNEDEDEDGKDTIIDTTKLISGTRIFAAPKRFPKWYIRRDLAIEIKREQGCVGIGFYSQRGGLINNGKIIVR